MKKEVIVFLGAILVIMYLAVSDLRDKIAEQDLKTYAVVSEAKKLTATDREKIDFLERHGVLFEISATDTGEMPVPETTCYNIDSKKGLLEIQNSFSRIKNGTASNQEIEEAMYCIPQLMLDRELNDKIRLLHPNVRKVYMLFNSGEKILQQQGSKIHEIALRVGEEFQDLRQSDNGQKNALNEVLFSIKTEVLSLKLNYCQAKDNPMQCAQELSYEDVLDEILTSKDIEKQYKKAVVLEKNYHMIHQEYRKAKSRYDLIVSWLPKKADQN